MSGCRRSNILKDVHCVMQKASQEITSSQLNLESVYENGKTVFRTLKKNSLILITFYSVEAFTLYFTWLSGNVFGWMLIERSCNSFVFSIHFANVLVLNYPDFDAGPLSFFIIAADRN